MPENPEDQKGKDEQPQDVAKPAEAPDRNDWTVDISKTVERMVQRATFGKRTKECDQDMRPEE